MRVRLRGILSEITDATVILEREDAAFEVLVPAYALGELGAVRGQSVVLHTMEYYEGSAAGGNLIPRIVGFLQSDHRSFFESFITVKGIGVRKGLKALTEPTGRIAGHIESADAAALSRLPGIGKRTAEQIIVELRGKVQKFALSGSVKGAGMAEPSKLSRAQQDALELLVLWGDSRADAMRWIARVAELQSDLKEVEAWVKAAYRIKAGVDSISSS